MARSFPLARAGLLLAAALSSLGACGGADSHAPPTQGHTPSRDGTPPATVASELAGPAFALDEPLVDLTLRPADRPLTVKVGENVSLTLPPAVLSGGGRVTVAPARVLRPGTCGRFESLALHDITLTRAGEVVHELPEDAEIRVRFDPSQIDADLPPSEQLLAARWDEGRSLWVELPSQIDARQGLVVARTRHLSVQGILSWIHSTAIVTFEPITHFSDRVTKIKYFNIVYDPSALEQTVFIRGWTGDGTRGEKGFPDAYAHLWSVQAPGARCFIRDVAYYLAQTYDAYTREQLGTLPRRPILVKIGPGMAGKDPARFDHVTLNMNVSSDEIPSARPKLKHVLAHELFHAIQNQDLDHDAEKACARESLWWIEATAEYAACRVAWDLDSMGGLTAGPDQIYPYLLERPLTQSGTFPCPHGLPDTGGDIEYDRGYLLDYLAQRGVAFAPLYKHVIGQYRETGDALVPFETHVARSAPSALRDLHRDYVGWFLFDSRAPRARSAEPDPLHSTSARRAADLPSDGPLALPVFDLAASYTAAPQAVRPGRVEGPEARTIDVRATALDAWAVVDLYVLPDGKRVLAPKPTASVSDTHTSARLELAPGQTLYVVAVNPDGRRGASARVEVRPVAAVPPARVTVNYRLKGTMEKTSQVLDQESDDRRLVSRVERLPLEIAGFLPDLPITLEGLSFHGTATETGREEWTEVRGTFADDYTTLSRLTIHHYARQYTKPVYDLPAMDERGGHERVLDYTLTISGFASGEPRRGGVRSYTASIDPASPPVADYSLRHRVLSAVGGGEHVSDSWSEGGAVLREGDVVVVAQPGTAAAR